MRTFLLGGGLENRPSATLNKVEGRYSGLCNRRAPESKRCFLNVHALVRNRFMAHDSQTA
jgi:hypothetical protein